MPAVENPYTLNDVPLRDIVSNVLSGTLSPEAILAAYQEVHRATHQRINALVQPSDSRVFIDAQRLTRTPQGALAGVTVSIKDCFAVEGLATTLGVPLRVGAVDESDCSLVSRLRMLGALVVGKSNVPQLMYLHETSNPLWGQTNHPFDSRRSPGGSSGGDAALVAAGVVMLGIGNDLLGSIRQPAHACGIAGFVPSDSILGSGDAFNTMPSQMVVRARAGFLARRVDDLAMAMESLAVCRSEPSAAEKMRVGWWLDSGPIQPSPAVSRAVEEASMRISMSGVDVKRISGHLSIDAAWLHLAIVAADGGREVRRWLQNSRPMRDVERLLRLAALPRSVRHTVAQLAKWTGRSIEAEALRATGIRTDDEFMELVKRRELIRAQWQSMLSEQRCDVILCPVSALPAMPHGLASKLLLAAMPCFAANLLGLPCGTVPVSIVGQEEQYSRGASWDPVRQAARKTDFGSSGLPVGVQVIGRPGGDIEVLDVMRRIERYSAEYGKSSHRRA